MVCTGETWAMWTIKNTSPIRKTGWWFGCHQFYFPRNIGNVIIPIDFHIFQRGGPTTNQYHTAVENPGRGMERQRVSRPKSASFIMFWQDLILRNPSNKAHEGRSAGRKLNMELVRRKSRNRDEISMVFTTGDSDWELVCIPVPDAPWCWNIYIHNWAINMGFLCR